MEQRILRVAPARGHRATPARWLRGPVVIGWATPAPWSSARRRPDGWAVPWSQPSGATPARGSAGRRRPDGCAVPLQVETRRRPRGHRPDAGPMAARSRGSAGRRRPRGHRPDAGPMAGRSLSRSKPDAGPMAGRSRGRNPPARRRPVVPPIAPARRPNILTQWATLQSRLRV